MKKLFRRLMFPEGIDIIFEIQGRSVRGTFRAWKIPAGVFSWGTMNCPLCTMDDVLETSDGYECVTCGHEWVRTDQTEPEVSGPEELVVKDAYGNLLADGDVVAMIKDLKLKGSSEVLKSGTKSKPIRLREGDHEIDCRMNGMAIALKAMYVKKVEAK